MEANLRWTLITAIAPVAWGTNYYVTHQYLPAGEPLYGAAIRALPAGLLLLAVCRERPRGSWWWKSAVLGVLNMGGFFALVYVAAQRLPTSVASTIMATSSLVMMLIAWALLAERPRLPHLAGAAAGIGGVALMLTTGATSADPLGVLASVAAMLMSSYGYILAKRWGRDVPVLASTSWQLIAGGLLLIPLAVAVEGAPPALDAPAALGFGYVTTVATALAFAAWFTGLRHLPAASVGLVGLLNPVTGVLLGTLVAGESFTARQLLGLALVLGGILAGRGGRLGRGQRWARGRLSVPSAMMKRSESPVPPALPVPPTLPALPVPPPRPEVSAMSTPLPTAGTLDPRFSDPTAEPSTWQDVHEVLDGAGTFWLTTVRTDGRPHVTPLIAVWQDRALHFCTGPGEQKSRNLAANPHVTLITGSNVLDEGLDVVTEGRAIRVTDAARLTRLAEAWETKYGKDWHFEVRDGSFWHGGGLATVYEVAPTTVYAFRKSGTYAQTRWRLS